jgi:hypothetical protein
LIPGEIQLNLKKKYKAPWEVMMIKIRFAWILLLFIVVAGGCGLKDRRADKLRSQYPGWDDATVEAVAARKVATGMNKAMVMSALGNPDSINQEGNEEKWTYGINRERDIGAIVRIPVFWVYFKGEKVIRTEGDWKKLGYTFYGW